MRSALNCKVLEEPKDHKQREFIKMAVQIHFSLAFVVIKTCGYRFLPGYCLGRKISTETCLSRNNVPVTARSVDHPE